MRAAASLTSHNHPLFILRESLLVRWDEVVDSNILAALLLVRHVELSAAPHWIEDAWLAKAADIILATTLDTDEAVINKEISDRIVSDIARDNLALLVIVYVSAVVSVGEVAAVNQASAANLGIATCHLISSEPGGGGSLRIAPRRRCGVALVG